MARATYNFQHALDFLPMYTPINSSLLALQHEVPF